MKARLEKHQSDAPEMADFVQLFGKTQHRVQAFILTLLSRQLDAEEVLQETSVVAWQKFQQFSCDSETVEDDFVRWVCTIARFQVLAFLGKQKKGRITFSESVIDDLAARALKADQQDEQRRVALASCLDRLTEDDRDLFRRFYVDNATAQQIAEGLNGSARAIYRVLHKTRRSLLLCIERSLAA